MKLPLSGVADQVTNEDLIVDLTLVMSDVNHLYFKKFLRLNILL
jgi:hypothetical protein